VACSRGHCCYQSDGFMSDSSVYDSERVDVELTLLTRIQEVLGSNLGRVIGYPDRSFRIFSLIPPGMSWDSVSIRPWPKSCPHLFTHPTLCGLATDSGRAV
jgi:hypothetical protein